MVALWAGTKVAPMEQSRAVAKDRWMVAHWVELTACWRAESKAAKWAD